MQTQIAVIATKQRSDLQRVYDTVNAAWQCERCDLPPLEYDEACRAITRLWFAAFESPLNANVKFKQTSGNRHTWMRHNVWSVNCDSSPGSRGGWWHLVHNLAHFAHARLLPDARPHDPREAYLERRLIEHVVANGWLQGKLKSKKRAIAAKPTPTAQDRIALKLTNIDKRLARWYTKQKRAERAIKKLEATRKRYMKQKEKAS